MSMMVMLGILAGSLLIEKAYRQDPGLVAVKPTKVLEFVKFMFAVSIVRVLAMAFIDTPEVPAQLSESSLLSFVRVFWEDAVFVLPVLMWEKWKKPSKWLLYPVLALSASLFGLGHLYQGWKGFVFSFCYLIFASYRYGKKHGLGTVMICHVIYDMMTVWVFTSMSET